MLIILKGYRLDFNKLSRTWDGSPSTVVPDDENHVWGALWQLNISDKKNLDKQEGVGSKMYEPFEAIVVTPDGKDLSCRCYKLVDQPKKVIPIPLERRPSKSYIRTILIGAKESNLPSEYLKFLNEIPNNGKDGPSMPWLDDFNVHNLTMNISETKMNS